MKHDAGETVIFLIWVLTWVVWIIIAYLIASWVGYAIVDYLFP